LSNLQITVLLPGHWLDRHMGIWITWDPNYIIPWLWFVDWLMKCQHSTVISLQMDLVTLPRLWFHQSLIKKTITFYLSA